MSLIQREGRGRGWKFEDVREKGKENTYCVSENGIHFKEGSRVETGRQ